MSMPLFLDMRFRYVYWLRWQCRNILKEQYGQIAKQTDNMLGVILSNGRKIKYGKEYSKAYFAGRIR
jgi:CDP-diacylglycerol pyrophosphatase